VWIFLLCQIRFSSWGKNFASLLGYDHGQKNFYLDVLLKVGKIR
jgi:hypothetical protein